MKWEIRLQTMPGVNPGNRVAELDIYDVVGDPYNGGASAQGVLWQLRNLDVEEILVRVNSVGGVVSEGMDIYNLLKEHPAKKTVRVSGVAASIATVIACAADAGSLQMYANSLWMVHEPSASPDPYGPPMREEDLIRNAGLLSKIKTQMYAIYAARTGMDLKALATMCQAESWFTAAEALELKFCDQILGDEEADMEVSARAWDERVIASYSRMPRILTMAACAARMPERRPGAEQHHEEQMDPKIFAKIKLLADARTESERKRILAEIEGMSPEAKSEELKSLEAEVAELGKHAKGLEAELEGMKTASDEYKATKGRAEKAEQALADLKKEMESLKAKEKDDDDSDDDDEDDSTGNPFKKKAVKSATKAQLRRVVRAAMAVTDQTDMEKLEGAVMSFALVKVTAKANSSAARELKVKKLIEAKELFPVMKGWALKCSDEALDQFVLEVKQQGKRMGPADESVPDPKAAAVKRAEGVTSDDITLSADELKLCAQSGTSQAQMIAFKREQLGLPPAAPSN